MGRASMTQRSRTAGFSCPKTKPKELSPKKAKALPQIENAKDHGVGRASRLPVIRQESKLKNAGNLRHGFIVKLPQRAPMRWNRLSTVMPALVRASTSFLRGLS